MRETGDRPAGPAYAEGSPVIGQSCSGCVSGEMGAVDAGLLSMLGVVGFVDSYNPE